MSDPTKIVNLYTHLKKEDNGLRHYALEDALQIFLPFRMLVLGPSGSGKTNIFLNMMKMMGIFDKVILLAKDLEEPLYQHLIETYAKIEKKLKTKILLAISTTDDMPEVNDCNPKENTLLIIDDMICENKKDLAKIGAFWIRARKKGVSMAFLSQSYYAVPKLIRQNTQYIIVKEFETVKDVKALMAECSLGIDRKELMRLYDTALNDSTEDPMSRFFMLDFANPKKQYRFRANFTPIGPTK